MDRERDDGDGHERLVGHRVDDGPHDRLLVPVARDVAVEAVSDGGVGKEGQGGPRLAGQDEVAD